MENSPKVAVRVQTSDDVRPETKKIPQMIFTVKTIVLVIDSSSTWNHCLLLATDRKTFG